MQTSLICYKHQAVNDEASQLLVISLNLSSYLHMLRVFFSLIVILVYSSTVTCWTRAFVILEV